MQTERSGEQSNEQIGYDMKEQCTDIEGVIGWHLLNLQMKKVKRKEALTEIFKLFKEQQEQYENEIRDKDSEIKKLYEALPKAYHEGYSDCMSAC